MPIFARALDSKKSETNINSQAYLAPLQQICSLYMLGLRQELIENGHEKIGWMRGFSWSAESAMDLQVYRQFWYGNASEQNDVLRIVHKQIQLTRDYPEHFVIALFNFILDVLGLASYIVLIIGIIRLIETGEKDLLIVGCTIAVVVTYIRILERLLKTITLILLKRKLVAMTETCNNQLHKYGYSVGFPVTTLNFCFCLRCCACIKWKNFDMIEIYDLRTYRKGELNMTNQLEISTVTQPY